MKSYKFVQVVTEKEVERIHEWMALAEKYNLTLKEMRELLFYIDKIQELLHKKNR